MKKYNAIDLFCGCGGLSDGFQKQGDYRFLLHVDWEQAPLDALAQRLKEKWGEQDIDSKVLKFDIQKTTELLFGCPELKDKFPNGISVFKDGGVDVIIGGPPCQAYSIAGRPASQDRMNHDYRNYLFESYLKVVNFFRPRVVVFENVPGMLSARPNGIPIVDRIKKEFKKVGYITIDNFKDAQFDCSEYGVPQKRKRIIIVGLSETYFKGDAQALLHDFYANIMPSLKTNIIKTVRDAIGDLPQFTPAKDDSFPPYLPLPPLEVANHFPRNQKLRDRNVFELLARDDVGERKYKSREALIDLYNQTVGANTKVEKYCVQSWDRPSKTIVAHLSVDGLKFIHPDPAQARTLTVREAARLQSFDDDFHFPSSQAQNFKMIGNAVPPLFAETIAKAINIMIENYESKEANNIIHLTPPEQRQQEESWPAKEKGQQLELGLYYESKEANNIIHLTPPEQRQQEESWPAKEKGQQLKLFHA